MSLLYEPPLAQERSLVARAAAGRAGPHAAVSHAGGGHPLDAATRAYMEPRFGHDFSQVRVHTDAVASSTARAINARAYTAGHDVGFAPGEYAPDSPRGRRLIAHELAHVVQQRGTVDRAPAAVNSAGDRFEREASAAARRVVAGGPASVSPASGCAAIQREPPGTDDEKKAPEKPDAGEVIAEGLKTVAEQAVDNNPKVKSVIIAPIKARAKGEWGRLSTGEKAAVIGWGAGTLALSGGTMLSDPKGRKTLEGVNLAAPFTLIPYMPLSTFKYALPTGDTPETRLFRFETGFKADELLNLRSERQGLPKMTLGVNLRWGYDPATERLMVLGGDAKLGLVPGLSISAGAYKDVIPTRDVTIDESGQLTESKKRIPGPEKPEPTADVRIMVTVDLLKFKPGALKRQIKAIFR
jgi:uncharacterized protein DUF4157